MTKTFVRHLMARNRDLIHREGRYMNGFLHLVMKPRNTGESWTPAEIRHLKGYLRHLALFVPALAIFLLPLGSLLLPLLAEVLDRRGPHRYSPSPADTERVLADALEAAPGSASRTLEPGRSP